MLTLTPQRRSRRSAGFTMVEIAIVLVILGMTVALGLPSAISWMKDLRIRAGAESLRTGLEKARMDALRANRSVTFWLVSDAAKVPGSACKLSSAGQHWVVSVNDPEGKCDVSTPGTDPLLVYRSEASVDASQVVVAAVDADDKAVSSVTFNSLGQVAATGMIRQISLKPVSGTARELRIRVEPSGGVRSCDPAVGSGDPRACP